MAAGRDDFDDELAGLYDEAPKHDIEKLGLLYDQFTVFLDAFRTVSEISDMKQRDVLLRNLLSTKSTGFNFPLFFEEEIKKTFADYINCNVLNEVTKQIERSVSYLASPISQSMPFFSIRDLSIPEGLFNILGVLESEMLKVIADPKKHYDPMNREETPLLPDEEDPSIAALYDECPDEKPFRPTSPGAAGGGRA